MEKQLVVLYKTLVIGIIILFIGAAVAPTISSDTATSTTLNYNGSLLGYVNDTSGNPIEGARVRVYFHGTYEEDYSDSTGYYHVTNIPICWCYKNCTASKKGYETEWVLLGIYENTTYDFVLTPITQFDGSLSGYVKDTDMNPIEGARVQVYFHETYEEDYSDSTGYYHVNNIPKCYCLNATCSKEGYKTEWVLLSIVENTTYDFVLTSVNCPPNRPIINGPTRVPPGTYEYTFKATDPNGDDIKYYIDWEDGNKEETDFYPSGQEIELSHTFLKTSVYHVNAKAEDIHEMQSDVGTIPVRISQSRQLINLIISQFLEQFPFLEVFLRAMNLQR